MLSTATAGSGQRPRVLCVFPMIHAEGERILREVADVSIASAPDEETLCREAAGVAAIVARVGTRITGRVMDASGGSLRVLSSNGSGVDSIDVAAATARGIPVVNARGVAPGPVAEHAIGLMLAVLKHIALADRFVRAGGLGHEVPFPMRRFEGRELTGKTVGIVGFGMIGRDVARRLQAAFSARILAYDPALDPADIKAEGAEPCTRLDDLMNRADVVSLHCPLSDETRGLIGREALAALKPGAVIVNCARGGVVDEAALADALSTGRVGGAGLDVLEQDPPGESTPLLQFPNVVVTPHIAGFTGEAVLRLATSVATDVLRVLRGERPAHLVNPEVWPGSR